MTLNWSVQNVKYFDENPDALWAKYNEGTPEEYEDVNAETKSLIFATMALGIGELNYKNAPDFYARWKVMEKYDNWYFVGRFIDGKTQKSYLTPKDVIRHLNLSTNVSHETTTKWAERIYKAFSRTSYMDEENKPTLAEIKKTIRFAQHEFISSL